MARSGRSGSLRARGLGKRPEIAHADATRVSVTVRRIGRRFYLATGRQLWDASLITVPTLVIASEHDFWSRPEDRNNLMDDLVHARKTKLVTIPGANHFVHLERPGHGRDILIKEIIAFTEAD